ncbi:MAG: prepilin-type N-terminal cleavage/methylation domain-containing protein [Planctomycetota bacterium]
MSSQRRPSNASRETRKGFTLIELLVVIAIIALLIGILLPALGKARQSARKAVSLSNMRQLGTAVALYVNDEDEYLPSPGYVNNAATPLDGWLFDTFHEDHYTANTGGGYVNLAQALQDELWGKQATGQLWTYLGGEKNRFSEGIAEYFRSPSDRGPYNEFLVSPVEELTSYVANGAFQGFRPPPSRFTDAGRWPSRYKISSIYFPDAIFFWEGAWPEDGVRDRIWVSPSGWGGEAGVNWYGNFGSNTARIDGSASWVDGKGQEARLNPTNPRAVERFEDEGIGQLGEWHRQAVGREDPVTKEAVNPGAPYYRNPLYPIPRPISEAPNDSESWK